MRLLTAALAIATTQQPVTTRDSAGIEIIAVAARGLAALPVWSLEANPLQIGQVDGPPEYTFDLIGLPVSLGDGRIVVPNGQHELRYFDASGRHLRTVGRRGQGPGEHRQLWSIRRMRGDTLLVYDIVNGISIRDPAGRFVRQSPFQPMASFPLGLAWIDDTTAAYMDYGGNRVYERARGPTVVVFQDTTLLMRARLGADARDSLARLPGTWWAGANRSITGVELSGAPILAANGQAIVAGHGDAFVLRWYTPGGSLVRLIRVDVGRQPVDRRATARHDAIERSRLAQMRRLPSEGPAQPLRRFAAHLPVIDRAVFDSDGYLWVRRWTFADDTTTQWIVFDRTGRPVAQARFPTGLRVSEIGRDWVLGVFRDEDWVPFIRRYRLGRRT